MDVLILGGGGFIGGHMARHHKRQGHWVRVVDLRRHRYYAEGDICDEFDIADLRDPREVDRVMVGPHRSFDRVYQFAADLGGAGYVFTGKNDADIISNSVLINLNVAQMASRHKAKRVFFSSSSCVYPVRSMYDVATLTCEESTAYPANPDSDYGWEKLFSERIYQAFARNYGLEVRIGRIFNVFGTHDIFDGGKEKAPAAICRKVICADREIEIWGDGEQARSFLFHDECIDGIEHLMASDFKGPVNIGSTEMISINELADIIIDISGKSLNMKHIDGPIGVMARNSHNDLIQSELRWKPTARLRDGLELTYNWILSKMGK